MCPLYSNLQLKDVCISLDLLLRKGSEIILRQPDNKKRPAKNIVRYPFIIRQNAVPRQPKKFSFVITDDGDGICKGIQCLNQSAYLMLQDCKIRRNFSGIRLFVRFYDEYANGLGCETPCPLW